MSHLAKAILQKAVTSSPATCKAHIGSMLFSIAGIWHLHYIHASFPVDSDSERRRIRYTDLLCILSNI